MQKLDKVTVGQLLEQVARMYPDNEALVYNDRDLRYSYREFNRLCRVVARGLMAMGIKKGDHIAVWATNVPEWVLLQFAVGKMGAVLVTVNTNYKTFELKYLLEQSDSTSLFMAAGTKTSSYIDMIYELCPELKESKPGQLNSDNLPLLKNVVLLGAENYPGMFNWSDLLAMAEQVSEEELDARMASLDPDDVINMQYTSGTTGFPKGVMLSHTNVVGNARSIAQCLKFTYRDRLCIPVPFFHCFGCVLGTLTCVVSGATMVPVERFNPQVVLEVIEKERCTAVHGVPTMFIMELEELDKSNYDLSSLRTGIMAGAPCPIEVMNAVIKRMNMKEIVITYGQTEASPGITMTRTDDPVEIRVNTVGRALPNVEMKVIDPATGREVPPGVQGEVCARGYNVMKGYYKDPAATAQAIDKDGWLHTGDLGVADSSGYLKITGRLKDMIIRGGENIYPREIEEFLYTHPKVKEVQVIGVPSVKYGEEVLAFIRLKEGVTCSKEEIQEYCVDKIARYKIPRYVLFVENYPTTASGKVQKFKLREQAMEMLGLKNSADFDGAGV
ncbi:fatty-acyl-CoA synthase [Desulfohalotomaculum tongense]|uniref:AMP-binding protein n=1 Tax=Desulforadius tongensis TaxID=1216062 RepID=UPI00195A1669|nr:AMP-binding protein [Desulforadius tongensis]MBM7855690.1 fatty-acyl-CoA synthase [Desulforadius tongensis]